jgi:SAM-dependent methyltransferase
VSPARHRGRGASKKAEINGSSDPTYGQQYFEEYRLATGKVAYENNAHLHRFFASVADHIVHDINPRTVLDAGCAMGFLVAALRDRGVEAYGVDISRYAIDRVRADIKPFCRQGSLTEPLSDKYELVVCIEVLEHLMAEDALRAVANICAATSDVLFSSTPGDHEEPTHLNVQPPEWWTEAFGREGFYRDVDYDPGTYLSPWAVRYRRSRDTVARTVSGYERLVWRVKTENQALRQSSQQLRDRVEQLETMAFELEAIKQTAGYRIQNAPKKFVKRLFPSATGRGRWLRGWIGGGSQAGP